MSSSSLRKRDEVDAKSTSDVNMIEMKKKRSDNDKTMKDLRAKIILIAELYEFRTKEMMSVLDQLIKTSRVTRANDVSSMFKSTKTIKKLKEMTTRLKKIAKKKKTYQEKNNTWATIARRRIAMIKFDVNATKTSTLSSKKELKIAMKMIEQKKIQMTQKMTSKKIVKKARDTSAKQSSRKNILTARCHFEEIIVLKINNEKSRKALKSNEEWTKEICEKTNLKRQMNVVIVHDIRVKNILNQNEKWEKKTIKALKKMNATFHSNLKIENIRWISKKNHKKNFSSMMLKLANLDMINKLIHHDILHEYTSKIVKYYESMSRIQQCFKCQKYDHKTYECRNKQTCEYCAKKHRIEHCDVKKQTNRHRCDACQENHVEWHIECSIRKKDWIKTKKTLRNKFVLHVVNTTTSSANISFFFMSTIFFAVTIEQKKRKITISTSQRNRFTSETKQQKQNEINVQTTTMKRILRKRKMSIISTVSHSSSQKTLVKWEKDVVIEKFND